MPLEAGLIVADPYGAEIVREAELRRMTPPSHSALLLRFALAGAFVGSYGQGEIFDSHGFSIDGWTASGSPIATHIRLSSSTSRAKCCCGSATGTFRDGWPLSIIQHAPSAAPDGVIYVADGHGNAQIHRFSPQGEWHASSARLAKVHEFMTPHSIIVDRQGPLVVCDRENDCLHLFDRDGRWLTEWRGLCRPMDLCERDDGAILVTELKLVSRPTGRGSGEDARLRMAPMASLSAEQAKFIWPRSIHRW
jgi:DNA repair protein MmcB-like